MTKRYFQKKLIQHKIKKYINKIIADILKLPHNPGNQTTMSESAFDETLVDGGEFVEFDDCTKLNNNKEAQKGGCSTGAIDNVVKLKKTPRNVNAPSLSK